MRRSFSIHSYKWQFASKAGGLLLAILFAVGCGGGALSPGATQSQTSPATTTAPPAGPNQFAFAGYTWEKDSGTAPPAGNVNGNVGIFSPSNVSVGSDLVLTLNQEQQDGGIQSDGAEVHTTQRFSYGTFEFTSWVSAAVSGTTASGFLFTNNSQTEIDLEQTGNKPYALDCTNWSGLTYYQDTEVTGFDQLLPHDFKIVWQPDEVDWYVDGQLIVTHTEFVPSAPAPFLFNMWGTNESTWGGSATPGVTRYMHITNFRYTPQAS
ncbi:MAG TPA: glycoside hydrolase family 16 protein [Terriglobales bacterium]|nr:glycoside hydrolase family 16 protein [Terriglobales bacterium]